MIGVNVQANPGVAREVAHAGHMIVNHTWTHPDLAYLSPVTVYDEMAYGTEAIHKATGRTPHMFRAPYGAWSPTVLGWCERIAGELFVSRKAVEYHLGNIYAKCGLQGRQELRRFVEQWRQPAAV